MINFKNIFARRDIGIGPVLVAAGVALPVIIVIVLSLGGSKPSSKAPDSASHPSSSQVQGHAPVINPHAEDKYLNAIPDPPGISTKPLPYADSEQRAMPTVDGVGVTGGNGWPNRSIMVKNSILLGNDLAALNQKTAAAIFKHMKIYADQGAIDQVRGIYDPQTDYSDQNQKLKFIFLVNNVQTGGHHGKIVVATGPKLQYERSYTVEYSDEDGKILLIKF